MTISALAMLTGMSLQIRKAFCWLARWVLRILRNYLDQPVKIDRV